MSAMHVAPMVPDDADDLLRLARIWGESFWHVTPGASGIVVRDQAHVKAFALLRETPHGHVIDEIREEPTTQGLRALAMLADWLETKMGEIAAARGERVALGGICRLDNPNHYAALKKRGYKEVANVLVKEFFP